VSDTPHGGLRTFHQTSTCPAQLGMSLGQFHQTGYEKVPDDSKVMQKYLDNYQVMSTWMSFSLRSSICRNASRIPPARRGR